jgi:hypothetical protein
MNRLSCSALVLVLKSLTLAASLFAGFVFLQGRAQAGEPKADFVVAPDGSDAAAGSVAAPFATVMRARDAVRELRRQRPEGLITVLVRGGTYRLDAPIEFTTEDSGAVAGKTVYAAWPDERPVFSGGCVIKGLKAGADGVWRANVGEFRFEQLYVNGRRAQRARTPNDFYCYARSQAPGAGPPLEPAGSDEIGRRAFRAYVKDIAPLRGLLPKQLRQVTVVVYNSWEVSRHHLAAANLDTGLLEMTGPYFVKFFHYARPKYFLIDCPGALDQPGEWTIGENGTLAYIPLQPSSSRPNCLI